MKRGCKKIGENSGSRARRSPTLWTGPALAFQGLDVENDVGKISEKITSTEKKMRFKRGEERCKPG